MLFPSGLGVEVLLKSLRALGASGPAEIKASPLKGARLRRGVADSLSVLKLVGVGRLAKDPVTHRKSPQTPALPGLSLGPRSSEICFSLLSSDDWDWLALDACGRWALREIQLITGMGKDTLLYRVEECETAKPQPGGSWSQDPKPHQGSRFVPPLSLWSSGHSPV